MRLLKSNSIEISASLEYLEVFFGTMQNLINVTGDMVTVAIEEKDVWK